MDRVFAPAAPDRSRCTTTESSAANPVRDPVLKVERAADRQVEREREREQTDRQPDRVFVFLQPVTESGSAL